MKPAIHAVLDFLRREAEGPADAELLARFAATRDEAAFAGLVRRHGPLVWGVCRRLLRCPHDAEDAFQATFLALARKAPTVVRREAIAAWLFRVARRAALAAAEANARRRARERGQDEMPDPEIEPAEAQDWRPLLDREVDRLPEKYRAAVVMCDLQGRPRRDVARELGVPPGTLSSRLAAAHRLLARRLAHSGLALSVGVLAATAAADAAVPSPVVTADSLAASPAAVALMKGVLNAMLFKKLRYVIVGAVLAGASLGVVGLAAQVGPPAEAADKAGAAQPAKPQSELEALRKENEQLKLNLEVLLEKVRSQEAELRGLRGAKGPAGPLGPAPRGPGGGGPADEIPPEPKVPKVPSVPPVGPLPPVPPGPPDQPTPPGPRGGPPATGPTPSGMKPTSGELTVVALEHLDARQAAKVIQELLEDDSKQTRVVADDRTNQILVQGSPDDLARVIKIVKLLDVPPKAKGGK